MGLPQFPGPWRALLAVAAFATVSQAYVAAQEPGEERVEELTPPTDSAAAAVSTAVELGDAASDIQISVVRISVKTRRPDLLKPWSRLSPRDGSGTGVVIPGHRILTNAHVVSYATEVRVQPLGAGSGFSAEVECFAPGIDLAVLRLDDESFFDTHPPLPAAGALPAVKDTVLTYGYPTGGTALALTKGIVSRIDFVPYKNDVSGLRIQIDAAINPGSSGSPVVVDGRMIGLAFGGLGNAQNIGYIIPWEEIELFLSDAADGHYDGKPAFFDEVMPLENEALRAALQIPKTVRGVLVRLPEDPAESYLLRAMDVITHIGDTALDNRGFVDGGGLRLNFRYFVQKSARDGMLLLKVIRDGAPLSLRVPVATSRASLVRDLGGSYPPYFIYGPLVFSTVSTNLVSMLTTAPRAEAAQTLLRAVAAMSADGNPILTRRGERASFPGEELVFVSTAMFPHRLGRDYRSPTLRVLAAVNGIPVRNLAHLVEVLRDAKDVYMHFDFAGRNNERIVLPRKEAVAALDEILTEAGIRAQASPEMLAIWNAPSGQ